MFVLPDIPKENPVLIAGPTASGKSDLALWIARRQGGVIVNADAMQVFDGWRILSARPTATQEAAAAHLLYGHVPHDQPYSVGHWLRDVAPILAAGQRPIIVGGTGLYLSALTEGLADIPATPPALRATADDMPLAALLADLDDATRLGLDTRNRARVQRAWEVLHATGRSLPDWHRDTPAPLLALHDATALVMQADVGWLNARIERRFDQMLAAGALDEARAMVDRWQPSHQSSKTIGAAELIAFLRGEITLDAARERAVIASRQYAKRQRTWFRSRMPQWQRVQAG